MAAKTIHLIKIWFISFHSWDTSLQSRSSSVRLQAHPFVVCAITNLPNIQSFKVQPNFKPFKLNRVHTGLTILKIMSFYKDLSACCKNHLAACFHCGQTNLNAGCVQHPSISWKLSWKLSFVYIMRGRYNLENIFDDFVLLILELKFFLFQILQTAFSRPDFHDFLISVSVEVQTKVDKVHLLECNESC